MSIDVTIVEKLSKTLAGDGGKKPVDFIEEKLPKLLGELVEENQKLKELSFLIEKISWPMPKKKNQKVYKN